MAGISEPLLAHDYQLSLAAEERSRQQENFNRQIQLQERAQRDAASTARVAGVADIGMGGANLYFANKYLNMLGGGKTGPAGLATMPSAATNYAVPALTPPGPLSGSLVAGGAAGGGAGVTGGGAAAPILSTQTSFPVSAEFAGLGESTAASAGATGAGLASAAGWGLAGGVGGFGLSKLLGANEDISQALTFGGAGVAAGFMVGGPVGAVVGGLIGSAISLFDDLF